MKCFYCDNKMKFVVCNVSAGWVSAMPYLECEHCHAKLDYFDCDISQSNNTIFQDCLDMLCYREPSNEFLIEYVRQKMLFWIKQLKYAHQRLADKPDFHPREFERYDCFILQKGIKI